MKIFITIITIFLSFSIFAKSTISQEISCKHNHIDTFAIRVQINSNDTFRMIFRAQDKTSSGKTFDTGAVGFKERHIKQSSQGLIVKGYLRLILNHSSRIDEFENGYLVFTTRVLINGKAFFKHRDAPLFKGGYVKCTVHRPGADPFKINKFLGIKRYKFEHYPL